MLQIKNKRFRTEQNIIISKQFPLWESDLQIKLALNSATSRGENRMWKVWLAPGLINPTSGSTLKGGSSGSPSSKEDILCRELAGLSGVLLPWDEREVLPGPSDILIALIQFFYYLHLMKISINTYFCGTSDHKHFKAEGLPPCSKHAVFPYVSIRTCQEYSSLTLPLFSIWRLKKHNITYENPKIQKSKYCMSAFKLTERLWSGTALCLWNGWVQYHIGIWRNHMWH